MPSRFLHKMIFLKCSIICLSSSRNNLNPQLSRSPSPIFIITYSLFMVTLFHSSNHISDSNWLLLQIFQLLLKLLSRHFLVIKLVFKLVNSDTARTRELPLRDRRELVARWHILLLVVFSLDNLIRFLLKLKLVFLSLQDLLLSILILLLGFRDLQELAYLL